MVVVNTTKMTGMEVRKVGQESQRSEVNARNRLGRKVLVAEMSFKLAVQLRCG